MHVTVALIINLLVVYCMPNENIMLFAGYGGRDPAADRRSRVHGHLRGGPTDETVSNLSIFARIQWDAVYATAIDD